MDAQQFRKQYSASSGMTPAEFDLLYVALPCGCDAPNCKGWAAVFNNPQSIKTHMELYAPDDGKDAGEKP